MDLATGAKQVYALMTLFARDGSPKLVPKCTYPLTGRNCVSRVYTDQAAFHLDGGQIVVSETFGLSFDELASSLDVDLIRLQEAGIR